MTDEELPPSPAEARATRIKAARSLGQRMDGLVGIVARTPGWLVALIAVAVVVAALPFETTSTTVFGSQLTNWLTLWMFNLVVVALAGGTIFLVFFLSRAAVAYIEEGRWPRRAGGVDMGDYTDAVDQIDRGAEELSHGADEARYFEKRLRQANQAIRYLAAELEKARGERSVEDGEGRDAREDRV